MSAAPAAAAAARRLSVRNRQKQSKIPTTHKVLKAGRQINKAQTS
jgi:hypothetical protein